MVYDTDMIPSPKLRRSLSVFVPGTVDGQMSRGDLDLESRSNKDLTVMKNVLLQGKFKHPRAKQMAAAAKFGWMLDYQDCLKPEYWLERISRLTIFYNSEQLFNNVFKITS